ncbi:hypothetical protein [[Mycoplasma] testudinis]|uniref:hypothetical protein n=1 Tax=[Mycoplasma] testudinis TaxID=33924 RepID=UPI00048A3526|nr:hypothetical protein [[Mycoplasma] testudinis]
MAKKIHNEINENSQELPTYEVELARVQIKRDFDQSFCDETDTQIDLTKAIKIPDEIILNENQVFSASEVLPTSVTILDEFENAVKTVKKFDVNNHEFEFEDDPTQQKDNPKLFAQIGNTIILNEADFIDLDKEIPVPQFKDVTNAIVNEFLVPDELVLKKPDYFSDLGTPLIQEIVDLPKIPADNHSQTVNSSKSLLNETISSNDDKDLTARPDKQIADESSFTKPQDDNDLQLAQTKEENSVDDLEYEPETPDNKDQFWWKFVGDENYGHIEDEEWVWDGYFESDGSFVYTLEVKDSIVENEFDDDSVKSTITDLPVLSSQTLQQRDQSSDSVNNTNEFSESYSSSATQLNLDSNQNLESHEQVDDTQLKPNPEVSVYQKILQATAYIVENQPESLFNSVEVDSINESNEPVNIANLPSQNDQYPVNQKNEDDLSSPSFIEQPIALANDVSLNEEVAEVAEFNQQTQTIEPITYRPTSKIEDSSQTLSSDKINQLVIDETIEASKTTANDNQIDLGQSNNKLTESDLKLFNESIDLFLETSYEKEQELNADNNLVQVAPVITPSLVPNDDIFLESKKLPNDNIQLLPVNNPSQIELETVLLEQEINIENNEQIFVQEPTYELYSDVNLVDSNSNVNSKVSHSLPTALNLYDIQPEKLVSASLDNLVIETTSVNSNLLVGNSPKSEDDLVLSEQENEIVNAAIHNSVFDADINKVETEIKNVLDDAMNSEIENKKDYQNSNTNEDILIEKQPHDSSSNLLQETKYEQSANQVLQEIQPQEVEPEIVEVIDNYQESSDLDYLDPVEAFSPMWMTPSEGHEIIETNELINLINEFKYSQSLNGDKDLIDNDYSLSSKLSEDVGFETNNNELSKEMISDFVSVCVFDNYVNVETQQQLDETFNKNHQITEMLPVNEKFALDSIPDDISSDINDSAFTSKKSLDSDNSQPTDVLLDTPAEKDQTQDEQIASKVYDFENMLNTKKPLAVYSEEDLLVDNLSSENASNRQDVIHGDEIIFGPERLQQSHDLETADIVVKKYHNLSETLIPIQSTLKVTTLSDWSLLNTSDLMINTDSLQINSESLSNESTNAIAVPEHLLTNTFDEQNSDLFVLDPPIIELNRDIEKEHKVNLGFLDSAEISPPETVLTKLIDNLEKDTPVDSLVVSEEELVPPIIKTDNEISVVSKPELISNDIEAPTIIEDVFGSSLVNNHNSSLLNPNDNDYETPLFLSINDDSKKTENQFVQFNNKNQIIDSNKKVSVKKINSPKAVLEKSPLEFKNVKENLAHKKIQNKSQKQLNNHESLIKQDNLIEVSANLEFAPYTEDLLRNPGLFDDTYIESAINKENDYLLTQTLSRKDINPVDDDTAKLEKNLENYFTSTVFEDIYDHKNDSDLIPINHIITNQSRPSAQMFNENTFANIKSNDEFEVLSANKRISSLSDLNRRFEGPEIVVNTPSAASHKNFLKHDKRIKSFELLDLKNNINKLNEDLNKEQILVKKTKSNKIKNSLSLKKISPTKQTNSKKPEKLNKNYKTKQSKK